VLLTYAKNNKNSRTKNNNFRGLSAAAQNGISVHMDQTKEIYVWGDEFKIEEVLMNYFSNAVNHCEKEKVVEVKIEEMDGHARVSVFNTGMPIPEDSLPHLWEKFYKVDKARTREYGGSGIGLSIVKAIMESFHRECGVLNHEDGVEFWFELDTEKTGIGSGQAEDDTV